MFSLAPSSKQRLSPLTARILVVNSLPLLILVGSILYLSGYQDRLIQNELESMTKEARQFAAALGEGAVVSNEDERDLLVPELAQMIVQRLAESSDTRTRLYDRRGNEISDSSDIPGRSQIRSEALPPIGQSTFVADSWRAIKGWWRSDFWAHSYPPYTEKFETSSEDYPIVDEALDGEARGQVWQMHDGHIMLGVAVPVQRYKAVLGAVLLSRMGTNIEHAVSAERLDIFGLFLITLLLTILLSLYLARTIAKPLQELSAAAEGLKAGHIGALKWQATIPDLSPRRDEIGELSSALRAMVKALGERMHAIESFAADVAHELKNPLTSLHSAVETAIRLNDPVRQQKLMAVIADDVKRLDRLITDISGASRLEAELSRTHAKPIVLEHLLKAVVDLYAPLDPGEEEAMMNGQAPRVTLSTVALAQTGAADTAEKNTILGAEGRLVQVFQNLIDNALSFSPPGGEVAVHLVRIGDRLRIDVRDQGPGIPENKLEAIFERFYSERPAGEKFGTHSGLGLSIARQIIEAHQGTLTAINLKDPSSGSITGACFTVELPAS